jgi:xylitol oxidase
VLLISELRTVAADDFWISPFRGQDRVALHFTWRREPAAVAEVVTELEARLAEFDAVPHWGKFFRLPPARLAELHPGLGDFAALARRYDGSGTFSNDFVRRYVLDAAG